MAAGTWGWPMPPGPRRCLTEKVPRRYLIRRHLGLADARGTPQVPDGKGTSEVPDTQAPGPGPVPRYLLSLPKKTLLEL